MATVLSVIRKTAALVHKYALGTTNQVFPVGPMIRVSVPTFNFEFGAISSYSSSHQANGFKYKLPRRACCTSQKGLAGVQEVDARTLRASRKLESI